MTCSNTRAQVNSYPIIDSHIHLYATRHLPRLVWTNGLPSDHVLNRGHLVRDYRLVASIQGSDPGPDPDSGETSASRPEDEVKDRVRGFVFIETDRISTLEEDGGWADVLDEVEFVAGVARGLSRLDRYQDEDGSENDNEVSQPRDADLVLGLVPWAPVPAGPEILERYINRVREICADESMFALVRGFRYLLQDKPRGTMLKDEFVEGLKWLGRNGFTFDLGLDTRCGGVWQLEEAVEMLRRVYRDVARGGPGMEENKGGEGLTVVINHFCKPNLRLDPGEVVGGHVEFDNWARRIKQLAAFPRTYMKLSGFFSELPPQDEVSIMSLEELRARVELWVDVVFAAFGPDRIMFGSDWPVCNAGGPGNKSWSHWVRLVENILAAKDLNSEQRAMIWAGTAAKAYGIQS